jgi:hypothetical protein
MLQRLTQICSAREHSMPHSLSIHNPQCHNTLRRKAEMRNVELENKKMQNRLTSTQSQLNWKHLKKHFMKTTEYKRRLLKLKQRPYFTLSVAFLVSKFQLKAIIYLKIESAYRMKYPLLTKKALRIPTIQGINILNCNFWYIDY